MFLAIIGPPKVTLTECGNCIQINISLPEADKSSGIPNNDIMAIYKAKFRVLWKKSNKIEVRDPTYRSQMNLKKNVGCKFLFDLPVLFRLTTKQQ